MSVSKVSIQSPAAVVMVRPHHFHPNPQTAADNGFQQPCRLPADELARRAFEEVTRAAETLRLEGVAVELFEDEGWGSPDSVFPNNWFSTHGDGSLISYPMYCANRRLERRKDILDALMARYRVARMYDYSALENQGRFLEGTGAMVLDHLSRVAYVIRSRRADPRALDAFCRDLGYRAVVFDATDDAGLPVYHTNVLMAVATEFAVIGSEMITEPAVRESVLGRLAASGREIIELSSAQISGFAGNLLELNSPTGPLVALSTTALAALTPAQISRIEKYARLAPLEVPTIELAGGSVRCMLAGVHLPRN